MRIFLALSEDAIIDDNHDIPCIDSNGNCEIYEVDSIVKDKIIANDYFNDLYYEEKILLDWDEELYYKKDCKKILKWVKKKLSNEQDNDINKFLIDFSLLLERAINTDLALYFDI